MRIGILGGGQLARMMALAGHRLGFEFVFVDPAHDACARHLGEHRVRDWSGHAMVADLEGADRITFDFENVPAETLALLDAHFVVHPSPKALAVSQDRLAEKSLCVDLGLAVAPFLPVSSRPELMAAVAQINTPAILKTRRLGYDGKGQYLIRTAEDCEPAWQALGGSEAALILEGFVDFQCECALTAVRNAQGEVRFYPLSLTYHREGILRFAVAGAPCLVDKQDQAQAMVSALLERLDYVGAMSVEFFVTAHGLVVNEMAPRVHNSAHWSIEGAVCSQFENHLRAIADLPLGATDLTGASLMINCIGQMPDTQMLEIDRLHWHDYAKAPRPGRKVGHATWVVEDFSSLASGMHALSGYLSEDDFQALTGLIKSAG